MSDIDDYFAFLKRNGIPLYSINPGSDEFALTIDDAIKALDLLKQLENLFWALTFYQKKKMN